MALKNASNTRYGFGLVFTRLMPLNDDMSFPTSSNIVGGAGPFDFSGYLAPAAIPLSVKIDGDDAVSLTIDLSGAVDISAVTPAELAAALDVEFTAESLDLDASVDANGRVKIATTLTTDAPIWVQIYGPAANTAKFGQGFGMRFVKSDTLRTLTSTPVMKEEETFTTTDADGVDTEVMTDGYRKGASHTFVDTAEDWDLVSLIEGGTIDEDGVYEAPTSETEKTYFFMELFYKQYRKGTNKQGDIVGYRGELYRSCKGMVGDRVHEQGFMDGNFTVTGTAYKDPATGAQLPDFRNTPYTVEEFLALDLANV
jgi:hypothetical protein